MVPVADEGNLIMLPTERIRYSPINSRPPLKLPDGARMVVWTIVNVKKWDINQPMPRIVLTPPAASPASSSPMPDIPNWAWHEYGNRVGFWRMLEVLDALDIKAARLARARPHRDVEYAGPPGRARLRLCLRLGAG